MCPLPANHSNSDESARVAQDDQFDADADAESLASSSASEANTVPRTSPILSRTNEILGGIGAFAIAVIMLVLSLHGCFSTPTMRRIPDGNRANKDELVERLSAAGFEPVEVLREDINLKYDDGLPRRVVDVIPAPGTEAPIGSIVRVVSNSYSIVTWGPPRETVSCATSCTGLPFPTFNSLVETPYYGDERNFTTARVATPSPSTASTWSSDLVVEPDDEVEVRIWINNGGEERDLGEANRATGTRVGLDFSTSYFEGRSGIMGWVSADNTKPRQVFDATAIISESPVRLAYVRGSAVFTCPESKSVALAAKCGQLGDELFDESGILVSSSPAVEGDWWATYDYLATVTARFEVVPIG